MGGWGGWVCKGGGGGAARLRCADPVALLFGFELGFGNGGGGGGDVPSASHCLKSDSASQSMYAFVGLTRSPRDVSRPSRKSCASAFALRSVSSSTLSSIRSSTASGTEWLSCRLPLGHCPTTWISASEKMTFERAR